MIFILDFMPYSYFYYVGNGLYIIAYIALFLKIVKSLSFKHILRNFKLHLIVLTILNVYIAYVLQDIVNPYVGMTNEYFVEIVYNVSMLLVLTASLLNYFYRDDKKSLLIFLGSLSIVFSEVIGVAYLYVAQQNLLNFLVTTLTLLAFLTFSIALGRYLFALIPSTPTFYHTFFIFEVVTFVFSLAFFLYMKYLYNPRKNAHVEHVTAD